MKRMLLLSVYLVSRYSFANDLPVSCDCPKPTNVEAYLGQETATSLGKERKIYKGIIQSDGSDEATFYVVSWAQEGGERVTIQTRPRSRNELSYDIKYYSMLGGNHMDVDINTGDPIERTVEEKEEKYRMQDPINYPQYQLHATGETEIGRLRPVIDYTVYVRRGCGYGRNMRVSEEVEVSFSILCLPVYDIEKSVTDNGNGSGNAVLSWRERNSNSYLVSLSNNGTREKLFTKIPTVENSYTFNELDISSAYEFSVINQCKNNRESIPQYYTLLMNEDCPKPTIDLASYHSFDMSGRVTAYIIQASYTGKAADVVISYRRADAPDEESSWQERTVSGTEQENPSAIIKRGIAFVLGEGDAPIELNMSYRARVKVVCKTLSTTGIKITQSQWVYADLQPPFIAGMNTSRNEGRAAYDAASQSIRVPLSQQSLQPFTYRIVDVLGREIKGASLSMESRSDQHAVISLQNVQPGIYIFTGSDNGHPLKYMFRID